MAAEPLLSVVRRLRHRYRNWKVKQDLKKVLRKERGFEERDAYE